MSQKIQTEFRKTQRKFGKRAWGQECFIQSAKAKIALQESQINLYEAIRRTKKIIALENYSRRENLLFIIIYFSNEEEHENCTDFVYDIVENGLK